MNMASVDARRWSTGAQRRDRRQWPYAHALWRDCDLLIETVHRSLWSLQMEVRVSRARVQRGEATDVWVDGVPDSVWREWPS